MALLLCILVFCALKKYVMYNNDLVIAAGGIISMKKVKNKLLRQIKDKVPEKYKPFLYSKKGILSLKEFIKAQKKVRIEIGNVLKDKETWRRGFAKYFWIYPKNYEIFNSFIHTDINIIKKRDILADYTKPPVICVVKDELSRIKVFFKHYRKLGIKHFIMVDNNSSDGTREWMMLQEDADVFLVKDEFTTLKKYGWINKILNYYGFNRWYLYADSDELFVYQEYENRPIEELVKYAEQNGLDRIGSIMIDMYSDGGLFQEVQDREDSYIDEYRYFDSNGYRLSKCLNGITLYGGPRSRVFGKTDSGISPLLIKHPLFYFKEGYIFESAHYIFPFCEKTSILSALLHYKFLQDDLERYKIIAEKGNYFSGSIEYKQYIKMWNENNNLNFMHSESVEFKTSKSLKKVEIIDKIIW